MLKQNELLWIASLASLLILGIISLNFKFLEYQTLNKQNVDLSSRIKYLEKTIPPTFNQEENPKDIEYPLKELLDKHCLKINESRQDNPEKEINFLLSGKFFSILSLLAEIPQKIPLKINSLDIEKVAGNQELSIELVFLPL